MPQDDAHFVNLCLAGDRGSYGELVRRYEHAVFALALSQVRHFADAEDIAQEAFVAAFEGLASLQSPDRFAPWLKSTVVNLCRNWHRHRKRAADSADAWGREMGHRQVDPPDQLLETADLRTRVLQAIGRLPDTQRQTVALYYIDGLSSQQIGSFLGVSPNTVDQRLHRAREQLKEEMIDMVEEVLKTSQPPEFQERVLQEIAQRALAALARQDRTAAVQQFAEALDHLESLEGSDTQRRWKADLLWARSRAAYFLEPDENMTVIPAVESSLQLERELGDRSRYANRLVALGVDYANGRRHVDSLAAFREAAEIFRELGQTDQQAWAVFWIGRQLIPWTPYVRQIADADYARSLAQFREAVELFGRGRDLLGKAQASAAVCLMERLGAEAKAPATANFSATALRLECTAEKLEHRSQPGFSQGENGSPGQALELMNKPSDWLHFPIEPHASWTSRAFAYGTEQLSATSRIRRVDAAMDTPAGSFQGCVELETVLERSGEDPNESYRRLNLSNSGVRTAYFAPGVGVVHLDFKHGDGALSQARLTACSVPHGAEGYLPLVPGATWEYAVTNSTSDVIIRDHYQVIDRDGDMAYVAEYSYSERGEEPLGHQGAG